MSLIYFVLKNNFTDSWRRKSLSIKIITIFFLIFIPISFGTTSFGLSHPDLLDLNIDLTSSEIHNKFFTYIKMYIAFVLISVIINPNLQYISRVFLPIYPVKKTTAATIHIILDLFKNKIILFLFIGMIGISIGVGPDGFKYIMGPFISIFIFTIISRMINTVSTRKVNLKVKTIIIICSLLFLVYSFWLPKFFGDFIYYIDLLCLPIFIIIGFRLEYKYVHLHEESNIKGLNFFSGLAYLLKNPSGKQTLKGLVILPLIFVGITFIFNVIESADDLFLSSDNFGFFLVFTTPGLLLTTIGGNFWVYYPGLFKTIDLNGGKIKSLYTEYMKVIIPLYLIVSIPSIIIHYFFLENTATYTLMYYSMLIGTIPVGMFFSLHKSKPIILVKRGSQKGHKPGYEGIISIIILLTISSIIVKLNLPYLCLIFPVIGIVFQLMMKEDYQKNRYNIYKNIRASI
ncbi:MAG: hypothetical protein ACEPOW_07860 [Bacteroidales bacterium]